MPLPSYRFELMDLPYFDMEKVSSVWYEVMARGRHATSLGISMVGRQAPSRSLVHSGEIDFKSYLVFDARGKCWH
jgi:hypothetical protein